MLTKSKLVLSAALLVGIVSAAAAESWDPVPGDRNPNPIAGQMQFESRGVSAPRMQVSPRSNAYQGRAEFSRVPQAPVYDGRPWGPVSSPSIYGGGF